MDALASIAAIPPAIDACFNLVQRLRGNSSQPEPADIEDLENKINIITSSMRSFTYVTVDLRPWKFAHHCTNEILHKEMDVLFKWSRAEISDFFRNSSPRIELELSKSTQYSSSRAYIQSKSFSELHLQLPEALEEISGNSRWHEFLLSSVKDLFKHHENRDDESFCVVLHKYRDFAIGLNHAADSYLLRGLDQITNKLDEIRDSLPAQKQS